MPANPAYLMALPTKNDPMLSYLTTAFQDHVRVRERFGFKVDDRMWAFFQKLGVIDADGRPTAHFGDPRGGGRGVFVATGHGPKPSDMDPALDQQVRGLYEDAKRCIHALLPTNFAATLASAVPVATR